MRVWWVVDIYMCVYVYVCVDGGECMRGGGDVALMLALPVL